MRRTVRAAEPGDAAGIAAVMADAPWYPQDPNHAPSAAIPNIRAILERSDGAAITVLVAVEEGTEEIVGYATVHWHPYIMLGGWEGLVAELFVAARCRGQGIGTTLLESVHTEASARGAVRLMLLNGRESEAYARGFYRRRGWRERDQMANFVHSLGRPVPLADPQEERDER
jgi:GNAT superfamily N-acetyltransferase